MTLANELRLGNLLLRAGHWVVVDTPVIMDIASDPAEAAQYERIPLTAAILDRCGFRNGSIRVSNDVGWAFRLEVEGGEIILGVKEYALPVGSKYLHQLQNLFYAITGEELRIVL